MYSYAGGTPRELGETTVADVPLKDGFLQPYTYPLLGVGAVMFFYTGLLALAPILGPQLAFCLCYKAADLTSSRNHSKTLFKAKTLLRKYVPGSEDELTADLLVCSRAT